MSGMLFQICIFSDVEQQNTILPAEQTIPTTLTAATNTGLNGELEDEFVKTIERKYAHVAYHH
jgi:hypothetical protein